MKLSGRWSHLGELMLDSVIETPPAPGHERHLQGSRHSRRADEVATTGQQSIAVLNRAGVAASRGAQALRAGKHHDIFHVVLFLRSLRFSR